MHDADLIEQDDLRRLERIYPAAVSPLMEKHKTTLARLDQLEKSGAYGRARVMLRRSGLLDDLAKAIASAGRQAAALIREEISRVKEAAADDERETG